MCVLTKELREELKCKTYRREISILKVRLWLMAKQLGTDHSDVITFHSQFKRFLHIVRKDLEGMD